MEYPCSQMEKENAGQSTRMIHLHEMSLKTMITPKWKKGIKHWNTQVEPMTYHLGIKRIDILIHDPALDPTR